VASERGEHFGVGDVLVVDMVLAGEGFAKKGRDEDARGKVGVSVKGEAVAEEKKRFRWDIDDEGGVGSLSVFPGSDGGAWLAARPSS
jgi:hypothetical protein